MSRFFLLFLRNHNIDLQSFTTTRMLVAKSSPARLKAW
nr:MAG TPA: hypothetical protein [Caudoviricetes sp.]